MQYILKLIISLVFCLNDKWYSKWWWRKEKEGGGGIVYLADSGKLFYRGIALRKETDEYHLP